MDNEPIDGLFLQGVCGETVTIPTLEGTIGSPVNFAYTPDFFVVMDPTQTIGFGVQPYLTVGGTLLDVKCNGSGVLAVNQNPGTNVLSLSPSEGSAIMSFGMTTGLNVEFIAFGDTVSGTLNIDQLPNNGDLGFYASNSFASYLLDNPITLSTNLSVPLLPPINTLDALTVWFDIIVPDRLANVNLDINADITLTQTVHGIGISTSAEEIGSEEQTLAVDVSATTFELQDIHETWNDETTLCSIQMPPMLDGPRVPTWLLTRREVSSGAKYFTHSLPHKPARMIFRNGMWQAACTSVISAGASALLRGRFGIG